MDCSQGLKNQVWYWGNSSKEVIAAAMEGKSDGTFAIRNSLSADGYTLTLRNDGINRLMRIYVSSGKCGFTMETLEFDSIVELINFYRSTSLKEFNDKLDIELIYPLSHHEKMVENNATRKKCPEDFPDKLNSLTQRHTLEGLHSEYERNSRKYDQLYLRRASLLEEKQTKNTKISAFTDAINIFESNIMKLTEAMAIEELSEQEKVIIKENIQLQRTRIVEIKHTEINLIKSVDDIDQTICGLDGELEKLKPRLLDSHRKREDCMNSLVLSSNYSPLQLDRFFHSIALCLDVEFEPVNEVLLQSTLQWPVKEWLVKNPDKEEAHLLVDKKLEETKFADGIFLIRPSKSKQGYYALEISKNAQVHSCLIEYCEPSTDNEAGGYAFSATNFFFPTLVDFVKYYSSISLTEHNDLLDTTLNIPALT